MGEADQGLQAECAGAALDRVDGAEHRVDPVRVVIALFNGQQAAFQLGQLLLALLKEGVSDCGERIHGG